MISGTGPRGDNCEPTSASLIYRHTPGPGKIQVPEQDDGLPLTRGMPHKNWGKAEASVGRTTKEENTPRHSKKSYHPDIPYPRAK